MRRALTIASYYYLTWTTLIVISVWLGVDARVVPAWAALPAGLLCLWYLFPHHDRKESSIRPHPVQPLLFVLVVLSAGAVRYFATKDIVPFLGTGIITLVPIFVYRKKRIFGHWMALITFSLIALISVVAKADLIPTAFFILYLVVLVFNLNSANLVEIGGQAALSQRIERGYFRQFVPSLITGMLAGAFIFVVFPRTETFDNPFGLRERNAETGYSGKVVLDGARPIIESTAPALMVESEDIGWLAVNASNLYFRGNTLDIFDGVHWSSATSPMQSYDHSTALRISSSFRLEVKELKLYREPHSTTAILYPGMLLGLEAPWRLLGGVRYDLNANVIRGTNEVLRYAYKVVTTPVVPPKEMKTLRLGDVATAVQSSSGRPTLDNVAFNQLRSLLQIPPEIGDADYFKSWVKEVGVTRDMTLAQVLLTLDRHFRDKFEATLANEFSHGVPFQSFLSKDRKGHCEYFASAGVMFLRAQGIPARIVLGYRGGTYNQLSRVLEVREGNAHAWLELFVPKIGWTLYDPTPMGPPVAAEGLPSTMLLYLNAAKFWFNRYVVNYDSHTQRDLVRNLFSFQKTKKKTDGGAWWNLRTFVMAGGGLALIAIAYLLATRKRRAARRRRQLPEFYREFQRRAAAAGMVRGRAETFGAFHARAKEGGLGDAPEIGAALEREIYSARSGEQ